MIPNLARIYASMLKRTMILPGDDGCWLFDGALDQNGHGNVRIKVFKGGEWVWSCTKAHRISYLFNFGEIPEGLVVRHKCDIRRCVAPHHILAGTQKENVRDMIQRNRYRGFKKEKVVAEECPF